MSIRFSTGMVGGALSTGSVKSLFTNGIMYIYSGTQPADADNAETGDLLCIVSVGGATFTPGAATAGLNFGDAVGKKISKASGEAWSGDFLMAGTMGWFRLYDNARDQGASTTAIRLDGSVGTSRSDIDAVTTTATVGGSTTFNSFGRSTDHGLQMADRRNVGRGASVSYRRSNTDHSV